MRAALYARVSSDAQTVDNQLPELQAYVAARGWTAVEYLDHGVSGATGSRPALDRLMADARRRRIDVLVVWSLDRFGRSLAHVVTAIQELHDRGVLFVSLREGLDLSSAAGRLQLHIMSALAEFERSRLIERTKAGLARAKRQGTRLGRRPHRISDADLAAVAALSLRAAAQQLGLPKSVVHRARQRQALVATAA